MFKLHAVVVSAIVAALPVTSFADTFPSKPIRMIVGFGPGGGNDVLARIVAEEMTRLSGQPVVVENRPGAGGLIGADAVAKAKPDGYTLFLGSTGTNTIAPAIYDNLTFDPRKDLAPVSVVARSGNLIVVNNDLPAANIEELIALAKKKPGQLNFGSSGNGSTVHLAGEMFAKAAGVDYVHVPYKGDVAALTDLVAGQIQLAFPGIPPSLPFAKANQLRVLAVTTPQRIESLPDVPTVAESGLPDYRFATWYGVFTTGGTDVAVLDRLNELVTKAMSNEAVRQKFSAQGVQPASNAWQAFTDEISKELDAHQKAVQEIGISVK